tara:strand:+ start:9961 stop:12825 length:2865 start_codon:yes stop_codon:yes gene_type:complete
MATIEARDTNSGGQQTGRRQISIRGARVNNLKDVDLDIPRNRLVVITGPSGSGKSSLAFETLYAEGQRQYIESLSVYARQFLNQMERPDVDMIEGLQPTICIDQRQGLQNPRSTVATVTEIYDHLRLLMARLGAPICYECGESIRQQSHEQIQDALMSMPEGTKSMIMAPMVRGRRGQHKEVLEQIRKVGFVRARIDGQVYDVDSFPELAPRKVHHIDAIVDRVIIRPGVRARIGESIKLALEYGEGLMMLCSYHITDQEQEIGEWRDTLFSARYACPNCNISYEEVEPRTFSFNSPYGACPACDGLGQSRQFDPEQVVPDIDLTLEEGAIAVWEGATPKRLQQYEQAVNEFLESKNVDRDLPIGEWPTRIQNQLFKGVGKKFAGLIGMLEHEYSTTTSKPRLEDLESYRDIVICTSCEGSRLRPEATSVKLGRFNIHEIVKLSIHQARDFFESLEFDSQDELVGRPIVNEIIHRLQFLAKVGVDYLTLDRSADTLSGGEMQRVRLASSIGSGLVGVCYILDEPSIGLHPRDNDRLIQSLRDLQQLGNTVIVVEHDEATMWEADQIIDVGPGAGHHGGLIIAQGTPAEVQADAASVTGQYLIGAKQIAIPRKRRKVKARKQIILKRATTNNLQNVTVKIPLETFVCITGVSGSGKSSLINETLARAITRHLGNKCPKPGPYGTLKGVEHIDKLVQITQSPIGRTPRSNAATYTGVFDEIRKVFAQTRDAKQRGYKANRFSFNVKQGRCNGCDGQGVQKIEMNFLPDMYVKCDQCHGARFNRATLQVRYKGLTIADVLDLPVSEAAEFFEYFENIHRTLKSLDDVGLGYLRLGQPSTTLSGGEAQRVKLANQLSRVDTGNTLYLLDEPTTGLHFEDIQRLLSVLGRLVDRGNTVVVIEHNLDVIKCADWIVDLGPEGGTGGGHVVSTGTPEDLSNVAESYTGQCLQSLLLGAAGE